MLSLNQGSAIVFHIYGRARVKSRALLLIFSNVERLG